MGATEALLPSDEAARLAALRRYELGTDPEAGLDRIVALAARVTTASAALVTLVDADRVWVKARHGAHGLASELPRRLGLCASVVLEDGPYVVTDAAVDSRTRDHPLVTGPPGVRFYAAVPLTTTEGHKIGALSVLDTAPRTVSSEELHRLRDLADLVLDHLELRRQARDALRTEEAQRHDAERLAEALQASLLPPTPPTVPGMEVATAFVAGERGMRVGGDFLDVFRVRANDWALVLGDVCGKGARAAALTGLARWTLRASALHAFAPSDVLRDLNAALLGDGSDADADDHFCTAAFGRLELDVCGAWVTLAVSGHPQPVLVRASGLVERRGVPSLPLGMFPDVDPVDDRVGLGPGDCLVFYTDGIIEARAEDGELFGTERLVGLLQKVIGLDARDIAERLMEEARLFCRTDLVDDAAVLVVRVPESARGAGPERVAAAIGQPVEELQLPTYPHGGQAPPGSNAEL